MRIKDPLGEPEEPFNLVPLTDMVFNLLIFFMAATTFAQVEKDIAIRLPHASNFTALSAVPKQMTINIDDKGQAIVVGKPLSDEALTEMVRNMVHQNKESSVIIRADENGRVKRFADVIHDCKVAGVSEAKIIYLEGK